VNFETALDLKLAALERSGELTDGTSDYDSICEEQLDAMYRALFAGGNEFNVDLGEAWEWAKNPTPGLLKLVAPYETGSCIVTLGSTSATFNTTPSSSLGSFADWFIRFNSRTSVYRISAHTSGAAGFTLDQEYLEATSSSLAFTAFKIDYDLTTNIERLTQAMRVFGTEVGNDRPGAIEGTDLSSFDQHYPRSHVRAGVPQKFALLKELNGLPTVRFSQFPSESLRVEYEYIPVAEKLAIKTFTAATTDVCTAANHGFRDGTQVKVVTTSALPTGLILETVYYIRDSALDTFKLAATSGGTAIDITGVGTGTHTISAIPKIPRAFRKVLMYAASHFILVDKSDSRSDYFHRQTQATLQALVTANRKMKRQISTNKGRMLTRLDARGGTPSLYDRIPWIYN